MATVNGAPQYGLVFAQRNKRITYGGVEYNTRVVKGYLDASGQLNDGAGNLWLDLIPNPGATPGDSYYVVTFNIQGRVHAEIWVVPDVASVAAEVCRQAQPPSSTAPALFYQFLQQDGDDLPQRQKLNFTGEGVSCVDNAGQLRTDCTLTGGGSVPKASATTSGTVKTDTTTSDPVVYLTSSADSLLASKAPIAHSHPESDVTNLVADLAGKVPNTRAINTTSPLSGGGALSSDLTLSLPAASGTQSGYLTSPNWTTFNNKEDALTFNSPLARSVSTISCPTCEVTGNKNAATGYAGLDASTKLSAAQLPTPGATTLGGVKSLTCSGTDKLSAISTDGVPVCSADQTGGSSSHEILSATHTDTTAASVVRGDLITGQGPTPKWARLAKGTPYQVLTGGANEPAWSAVALDQPTAVSGILAAANGGTGNAFFQVSGPATSVKTFTFPNQNATLEYQGNKDAASGYAGLTAGTKLNPTQGQEVWALSDLSDFTAKSGSGTTGIGTTLTSLAADDILQWSGTNWVNATAAPKATALAADPSDCGSNQYATAIAASGNLTCSQPSTSNLSDGSNVVKNNQANTYTAGSKQTFQNSATTAGLNLASSSDPSSLSQGDTWINGGDLKFRGASATQTVERQAAKNAASGYAGLDGSSKLTASQGQEVWASTDLTDFATKSGSGTTIIGATFTGLAANDLPIWDGSNWVNSTAAPKATALAANGSNCGANQYAQGVDASGVAEGCSQPSTSTLSDGSDVVKRNQPNTYSGGGLQDLSANKLALPAATTLPGTCTANKEIYVDTDATPAGQQVYLCNATGNGWNLIGDGGGGGGDNVSVNGTAATDADFDDSTPAAPAGAINVKWQKDASTPNNISAYVDYGSGLTVSASELVPDFATAGSAGISAYNAGTATTLARSDHTHRGFMSLSWHFPGSVVAGVQNARALVPEGVTSCALTNARITANTTASGSSTWNIQRCTGGAGNCSSTANIYSSNVTLSASTESVAGGTPNTTTVTAGDAFRVNLVSVGSGLADVTVTMTCKCENTN